jgi:hypothetical protein
MLEAKLREQYLDFVNNYLTIEKFAEHNGLELDEATSIIMIGKACHKRHCELVNG